MPEGDTPSCRAAGDGESSSWGSPVTRGCPSWRAASRCVSAAYSSVSVVAISFDGSFARVMALAETFQQIVASTNQQQLGIEQVMGALQNIRQASQQTAAAEHNGKLDQRIAGGHVVEHVPIHTLHVRHCRKPLLRGIQRKPHARGPAGPCRRPPAASHWRTAAAR